MRYMLIFILYFLTVLVIFNIYPILTIEPENLNEHFKVTFIASIMVGLYSAFKLLFIKILTIDGRYRHLKDSLILVLSLFRKYWYMIVVFTAVNIALVAVMYYIVINMLTMYSMILGILSYYTEILLFYLVGPLILFSDTMKIIRHNSISSRILKTIIIMSIPWILISILTSIIVDPFISSISETLDYPYFYPWSKSNILIYRRFLTTPVPSIGNVLSVIPISLYNRWISKIPAKNR